MQEMSAPASLQLEAVIGFNGKVPNGLRWHPDGNHIVYPLGTSVVIKSIVDGSQTFLTGHTDVVTTVSLSKCGRYIASGQRSPMGQRAAVILWDFHVGVSHAGSEQHDGEILHKLLLHKAGVQACEFSDDGKYLASLGGQDDNSLIIWECETGRAIVATPAANFAALSVVWYPGRNDRLVTAGQYHIRSWEFDSMRRRATPEDLKTGAVKRVYTCLACEEDSTIVYAGTSTGDVLSYSLTNGRFLQSSSHRFSLGALSIAAPAGSPSLLVGTGEGAVVKISRKELKFQTAVETMGSVTSIALASDCASAFVGTEGGNIYGLAVEGAGLEVQLRGTAHSEPIVDVIFPDRTSELFITASGCEIRVWHSIKRAELLRIRVPALKVLCVALNRAGTVILSGWDDGKIRAFTPETGKLLWIINDAHQDGTSAVAFTSDARRCISGGRDGRVRVWDLTSRSHTMLMSFKEHKKEVTCIRVSQNDEEALSSSADGSCCIWNLRRAARTNALFASTVFRCIQYHPDESQLLTCGTDRKVTYWDTTDCTAIRVMDAGQEEINCVDIDRTGVMFASGGADRVVKLWLYDEGEPIAVGTGHSGTITKTRISPDNRVIVSVGAEGAIYIWRMPSKQ